MTIFCSRRWSWFVAACAVAFLSAPFCLPTYAQVEVEDSEIRIEDDSAPQIEGELKTVAVVAGAPYGQLVSELTAVGKLAGKPEIGQMIEGGFAFFTQGKGPNAIDKTKPWGVIVQTDGSQFLPVLCVPVVKPDDLLAVATNFGAQSKDAGDGVKELSFANGKSFFVKVEDGWAFAAQSSISLARLPAEPQKILAKMVSDYVLAVNVSVKDVPEMYRQFAIQAMQAGLQQQMNQQPGESDEKFEIRRGLTEAQMEDVVKMINEMDSLTIGWGVDSDQQETFVDVNYLFQEGTKSANQLAAYSKMETAFAGFYQSDAALTMTSASKADPQAIADDLAQIENAIGSAREKINKKIDESERIEDDEARVALKAAVGDFFEAVLATIKAGKFDAGGALQLGAESATLVAGAHLQDTAKIESALKHLETAARKSPQFPGIEWNAVNHAGVNFHTITVPVPEDKKSVQQLLGDEFDVAVGIGPDAVYLAAGRNNIEALKQAIDASAKESGKVVPPFELAISVRPIAEAMAATPDNEHQAAIAKSVADMLGNEAQGRDHIRAVGQIVPNGFKYRIEAEEGVLRAIGTAGAEAQRQKLQAAQ